MESALSALSGQNGAESDQAGPQPPKLQFGDTYDNPNVTPPGWKPPF